MAACKEAKANALSSAASVPFAVLNASKGSFAAPAAVASILPLGVADNKFNPVLVKKPERLPGPKGVAALGANLFAKSILDCASDATSNAAFCGAFLNLFAESS